MALNLCCLHFLCILKKHIIVCFRAPICFITVLQNSEEQRNIDTNKPTDIKSRKIKKKKEKLGPDYCEIHYLCKSNET